MKPFDYSRVKCPGLNSINSEVPHTVNKPSPNALSIFVSTLPALSIDICQVYVVVINYSQCYYYTRTGGKGFSFTSNTTNGLWTAVTSSHCTVPLLDKSCPRESLLCPPTVHRDQMFTCHNYRLLLLHDTDTNVITERIIYIYIDIYIYFFSNAKIVFRKVDPNRRLDY